MDHCIASSVGDSLAKLNLLFETDYKKCWYFYLSSDILLDHFMVVYYYQDIFLHYRLYSEKCNDLCIEHLALLG